MVTYTESLQSPASVSVLRSSKRPRGQDEAPTEAHGPGSLTLRCDCFECACVLCHRLTLYRLESLAVLFRVHYVYSSSIFPVAEAAARVVCTAHLNDTSNAH